MELFVARQPILDAARRVTGYELLLHAPGTSALDPLSPADVADALLSVGLDTLVGNHLAFINVDDPDRIEDFAGLLPSGRVVLEIDAAWQLDKARIETYRALRRAGYALAADRFPRVDGPVGLFGEVDFVKMEANSGSSATERRLPARPGRPQRVALGVDTPRDLAVATSERFSLFQGRCFGRAASRTARVMPAPQWNCLSALAVVSRPEVTILELEQIIKTDAGLSLRLLRTANSAALALRSEVHSIREALVLLGIESVRHWMALWVVRTLGKGVHAELLATATIRAHCCEALAATIGERGGFIIGLCSPLGEILGQPMATVLEHLPLAPAAHAALMGETNHYSHVLSAAIAYERGDWEACCAEAAAVGADVSVLPRAYAQALHWQATSTKRTNASFSPGATAGIN